MRDQLRKIAAAFGNPQWIEFPADEPAPTPADTPERCPTAPVPPGDDDRDEYYQCIDCEREIGQYGRCAGCEATRAEVDRLLELRGRCFPGPLDNWAAAKIGELRGDF